MGSSTETVGSLHNPEARPTPSCVRIKMNLTVLLYKKINVGVKKKYSVFRKVSVFLNRYIMHDTQGRKTTCKGAS